jgi:hypothetical protein
MIAKNAMIGILSNTKIECQQLERQENKGSK